MKNTIIKCKSEEEYKAVLKKLEEKGCTWSSGHKPTEKSYYNEGYESIVVDDNTLTASSGVRVRHGFEIITADDFIGNKPIIIYKNGRNVVALDKNTGKKGIAKCHPDDEFDFYTGAKLAFSRLTGCKLVEFDGESKPDVSEDTDTAKFKVGDTVKVKSGLEVDEIYHGSSSPLVFYRTMKTNEPLKIESVSPTGNYYCSNGYYYTPEMIEKYNDFMADKFKVGDKVKLKGGLVVGEQYYGSSCPIRLLDDMNTDKPMTIKSISPACNYYCSNGYYYSPEMIEKYNEFAMDKFKVGDKVVLRTDLIVGNIYSGLPLLDGEMSCFGKVLTITNVWHRKGNIPTRYKCNNGYTYSEEMLINPRNAITIGSKIKVTNLSEVFPRYHEWVDKNVIESKDKVRYDYGVTLKEHVTGTVITIAPHLRYKNTKLVYFEYNGKCYLVDINGVEKA